MAKIPIHKAVTVDLKGVDGNAFNIIGVCSKAMRQAHVPAADAKAINDEAMAGDYDHLLQTYMRALNIEFGSDDEDECFGCGCSIEECECDDDEECDDCGCLICECYE